MNCRRVRALLSAYLDSELTGQEMLAIRDHVSRCEGCADERDSLRSIKMLLTGMPQREPRAEFAGEISNRIRYISLPLHERVRLVFTTPLSPTSMAGRRVLSAAMLSVLGVFLASGSFDHSVHDQSALTLSGLTSTMPNRFATMSMRYSPGSSLRLFDTSDKLLDPRRYPFDLSSTETPVLQVTSLTPQSRYNNVTLASFETTSGEPVPSR